MDFNTGKNIIIFDSRLRAKLNGNDTPCKPPQAWKVISARYLKLQKIIDDINSHLDQVKVVKADCLFIICHGAPAFLQLGIDNVHWNNTDLFKQLAGRVEKLVVIACSVAGQDNQTNYQEDAANGVSSVGKLYQWQMLQKVANNVMAPVKAGQTLQYYRWNLKTLEFEFEKWNGVFLNIFPNGIVIEGGSTE